MRLKGGPALATNNSLGNLGVLTPIALVTLVAWLSALKALSLLDRRAANEVR
jgi:hypothetical protein